MVRLENVSRVYKMGSGEVRALDNISLSVERGEFVCIAGPSGSGKSTLMNIIGCLDRPGAGRYFMDNVDVGGLDENGLAHIRNRKVGFIFQTFNLLARMNALKNVELPLIYYGYPRNKERLEMSRSALESIGLGDRLFHRPGELSGGQQQRVAIARALVTSPSILLADEPTGSLDSASGEEVMKIFSELNREGKTVFLVTHEELMLQYSQRIVRLKDGRIVEDYKKS